MNIDHSAPVITRDEINIEASPEAVWDVLTDINRWTTWNPSARDAWASSELKVGSVFYWVTAGMDMTSLVGEMDSPHKIAWSGSANGIARVHVWTLTHSPEGTLVRTDESWSGEMVVKHAAHFQDALDRSIRWWLTSLKRRVETLDRKAARGGGQTRPVLDFQSFGRDDAYLHDTIITDGGTV